MRLSEDGSCYTSFGATRRESSPGRIDYNKRLFEGGLRRGEKEKMADISLFPSCFILKTSLFPSSSFPSFLCSPPPPPSLEELFFFFFYFIIFGIPMVGLFFLRLTVKFFQPANQKVRDHKRQSSKPASLPLTWQRCPLKNGLPVEPVQSVRWRFSSHERRA
jgi:hypothetical protein